MVTSAKEIKKKKGEMERPWEEKQLQSGHGQPDTPLVSAGLAGRVHMKDCLLYV